MLHDLTESGLVFGTGSGRNTVYRLASDDELDRVAQLSDGSGADDEGILLHRGYPIDQLAENGDAEKKTRKQAKAWGGKAGEVYDRCYHEACDTIDNVNRYWPKIESVRPIQMSTRDALDTFVKGRERFTLDQWRDLLLRSVGFEPSRFTRREQDVLLARMVPFVVPNYNAVELGPRGTGKSHLFQQISPYAHLVSGGKATVARMFVNMSSGQTSRGRSQ